MARRGCLAHERVHRPSVWVLARVRLSAGSDKVSGWQPQHQQRHGRQTSKDGNPQLNRHTQAAVLVHAGPPAVARSVSGPRQRSTIAVRCVSKPRHGKVKGERRRVIRRSTACHRHYRRQSPCVQLRMHRDLTLVRPGLETLGSPDTTPRILLSLPCSSSSSSSSSSRPLSASARRLTAAPPNAPHRSERLPTTSLQPCQTSASTRRTETNRWRSVANERVHLQSPNPDTRGASGARRRQGPASSSHPLSVSCKAKRCFLERQRQPKSRSRDRSTWAILHRYSSTLPTRELGLVNAYRGPSSLSRCAVSCC